MPHSRLPGPARSPSPRRSCGSPTRTWSASSIRVPALCQRTATQRRERWSSTSCSSPVFAIHHSVLARPAVKRYITTVVPPELERSSYTWAASVLFAAVCWWWQPVPGNAVPARWPMARPGVRPPGDGFRPHHSCVAAARRPRSLGRSAVQRAIAAHPARHVALETGGVYGFVRHPLYFAWALFVFATPDMTATRLTFAIVSTLYLALAIPLEERGARRHIRPRVRRLPPTRALAHDPGPLLTSVGRRRGRRERDQHGGSEATETTRRRARCRRGRDATKLFRCASVPPFLRVDPVPSVPSVLRLSPPECG